MERIVKIFKVDDETKSVNIASIIRFIELLFEKLNETSSKNNISFNLFVLQCRMH